MLLSRIIVGESLGAPALTLTPFGKIVEQELSGLSKRFPTLVIEKSVIMPDHIHAIFTLTDPGGASPSPTLDRMVGALKSTTTRNCKMLQPMEHLWQRSFYDHAIRGEQDRREIMQYIENNPLRWALRCKKGKTD